MAFDVQKANIEITATDKTAVAFNSVKTSIAGLTSQFGAFTGLLGAGAFVAFTKRVIDQADSMNDLSKRTGIAVEQIGAWRLATEQSGTSMEALTSALGKGSKYLVQHGDDLKKIGINAKTSEELILQLSGVISKLPSDDPRRTALAMQVLGKSAGELIPLLSEGEEGLRGMLQRGRELNPVTADLAKNADEFNDNLAEMKLISGGLFVNLVGNILPSFNTYLKQLQMTVNDGDWMDKLLFFSVGYVSGKVADKTEKPEVQIQKYTQRIVELKKELAEFSDGKFGYRKDGLLAQIAEAEAGLAGQRQRLRGNFSPKGKIGGGTSYDATDLDGFLKPDGGTPKRDAIAERIKALGIENNLLAQGVTVEDARTIARLKGDGATDQQIVKMLNLTNAQTQYEDAEKKAEKTKQDLIKATEDHAEAMQKLLQSSDDAVATAQAQYLESERNLQVMQLGETAVIRMEAARLLEAAASAEQGLAYARLNGLSQENIDFTETQILRLKQLAEARNKYANSQDSTAAFEKEKDRIKDLEKAEKDAAKRVSDERQRLDDINTRSLTDSILRGFEGGKSALRNFRDSAQNMFKTLVLRPTIEFLINKSGITGLLGGLGGIFSGGANAGIAGASGGGFGGGFSLSSLGDIFKSSNASLVSGIESLGAFLSTGTGGLGDVLGGALGQYSSQIANVLPFAGVGLQLLQGNVKGALGAGLGAALSLTPLGPVGGLIGSIVGGSLFGGKKQPPRTVTQLPDVGKQFVDSLNVLSKGFGINTQANVNTFYTGRAGGSGYGAIRGTVNGVDIQKTTRYKDAYGDASMKQFINEVLVGDLKRAISLTDLPSGIKKFFTNLANQEEISATINGLVSINAQFKNLPPVFDSIKKALDTTEFNIGLAAIQKQFSDTSVFTSLFYTADEQFKIFTDQLTAQLTDLNTPLFKTRDEFRKLIDGFKVTDEESSKLFGGLVALAPAMDAYFKQIEAQQGLFKNLNTDYFSTAADYLGASALAGQGQDFSGQIGELSTVRQKTNAESNAMVKTLVNAQAETKSILEAVVLAVQETARLQKIWNGDGLPETRVV
jgi:hypothetical protein